MIDRWRAGPRLTEGPYLIRRAMEMALAGALDEVARRLPPAGDRLVLDIGGRGKPYASLLEARLGTGGHAVRHVAIDRGDGAEVVAAAEALPAATGRADLILCTQVLEHVADPEAAISEMARVLKPGGHCLLTTHGTWFYHPDPQDYWRWTSAGLRDLFARCGFSQVVVRPVGGTWLSLAALVLTALERRAEGGVAGQLVRRLFVAPANFLAARVLLGRAAGRESLPGELAINYIVGAVSARTSQEGC